MPEDDPPLTREQIEGIEAALRGEKSNWQVYDSIEDLERDLDVEAS